MNKHKIRETVRENYAQVAKGEKNIFESSSCCSSINPKAKAMSMELGYSEADVNAIPEGANMGLGCGNPKAIADLKPGETVLDLGSGGGFDCFLAAQEVGATGKVIGVDMTPEMISKARANVAEDQKDIIEFRLGEIEHLPVEDNSIDVIISNCVVNLSPEKPQVFKEALRVLKPGGRLAISDVVITIELPEDVKQDMHKYTACVSGASTLADIETMLVDASFTDIKLAPKDESKEFIKNWMPELDISHYVTSATIEAVKA